MKLMINRIVILILMVLCVGFCVTAYAVEVGQNADDFTLTDVNGKQVTLSDFKGKVIILDFFASWCPPCKQEVPDFIELQRMYGSRDFTMVGVALENEQNAKSFADSKGINYPVLVDNEKASEAYGPIRSIPTTFVIGKDFKVAKMYIGYRGKEVFEADVKELLK